jgi:cobalamin synthase
MSVFILNWIFLLALFPVAFFWLRRAWRILVRRDFSEVALKKGQPPADAEKYAPYEMGINLIGGTIMVVVLVAVLGFQALERQDWIAIAGSTLWMKLFASFALSRHAHGGISGLSKRADKEKRE